MSAAQVPYLTLNLEVYKAMRSVNAALEKSTLDRKLLNLVFQRVSQINGCAFCVDMHARALLALGDDLQRLNSIVAWREVTFFDARERAALQWAEIVTDIKETRAPASELAALKVHFNDRQIAELTYAIGLMNAWNRVTVGLHHPVARAPLEAMAEA